MWTASSAQILDVPLQNVIEPLRIYFGSAYVNDFNIFGRTYQVTAQADVPFRLEKAADLATEGPQRERRDMVMLGTLVDFRDIAGPERVARYNLYSATEMQGDRAGDQSGQGDQADEALAERPCRRASSTNGPICPIRRRKAHNPGHYIFPVWRAVRLPGPGGAVRKLDAAARYHPDRADVPVGRDPWRARHGPT